MGIEKPGKPDIDLYAYVRGRPVRSLDPSGFDDKILDPLELFEPPKSKPGPPPPLERALQMPPSAFPVGRSRTTASAVSALTSAWAKEDKTRVTMDVTKVPGERRKAASSGMSHLRSIGILAEKGAMKERTQHLHVFLHGIPIGREGKSGRPEDFELRFGSRASGGLNITYSLLEADPNTLNAEQARLRAEVDVELGKLKETFTKTGVTEMTLEECNVGLHQKMLDLLSERLGVTVSGHKGFVNVEWHGEPTGQGKHQHQRVVATMSRNESEWTVDKAGSGSWVEGKKQAWAAPNELLRADAHSRKRQP